MKFAKLGRVFVKLVAAWAVGVGAGGISTAEAQSCQGVSEIPAAECAALGSIYSSLNGPQWQISVGRWFANSNPCTWNGIVCQNGHVEGLTVTHQGVSGMIPEQIRDLTFVKSIHIYGRAISGVIPASIATLQQLETLNLEGSFSGEIPEELGQLSNLRALNLGLIDSSIEASIPSFIIRLPALTSLSLTGLGFKGPIPSEISLARNLRTLVIHRTNFSGEIPRGLSQLSLLQSLILYNSNLSGSVPAELGALLELRTLALDENDLTGTIPPELGNLTNLNSLSLSGNQLSGQIPSSLGSLRRLRLLALTRNRLSGALPTSLVQLNSLNELELGNNELEGEIPAFLGNMTALTELHLSHNRFTGDLPPSLGNLTNLVVLFLNNNRLRGPVPAEIGNLVNTGIIELSRNKLTCPLPRNLISLTRTSLNLRSNDGVIALDPELKLHLQTHPEISVDSADQDRDGIHSYYEDRNLNCDYDDDDTDRDGLANYLDSDDDGDNLPTLAENPDPNRDLNPSDAADLNRNSVPDYLENGPFALRGRVVDAEGQPLSGVALGAGSLGTVLSGSEGLFDFGYLLGGISYNILASLYGFDFPGAVAGTLSANQDLRLVGTRKLYRLSGRILPSDSLSSVSGVLVTAGRFGLVTTGESGAFAFSVPYRAEYSLVVSATGRSFLPNTAQGQMLADVQHNFVARCSTDVDGDGFTDCLADQCPNNPRLQLPNACGCALFESATAADSDGDTVEDQQELLDETNVCDSGSFFLRLRSPAYTKYNTFLEQQNFLELLAAGTRPISGRVSIYSLAGEVRAVIPFNLTPGEQRDIDIHGAANQSNTYGVVKIEFNDGDPEARLQGRMSHYRFDTAKNRYTFAFARELKNPTRGRTFATANSFDPQGRNYLVANWAELINLEETPQRFSYRLFDQTGALQASQSVTLPPFGEIDIQAGHERGEGVYLAEFIPESPTTRYLSAVARYSSNNSNPSSGDYAYAFSIDGKSGTGAEQQALISNLAEGCWSQTNWVEIVNTLSTSVTADATFFGPSGALLGTTSVPLAPYAQYHLNASALLKKQDVGAVRVSANEASALLAQSVVYYHDCQNNSLQTAFTTPARIPGRNLQVGSYNRFLGMENMLVVSNAPSNTQSLSLHVLSPAGVNLLDQQPSLSNGTFVLRYKERTPENTYGTVTIRSSSPRSFTADMLRLKSRDGVMEYVMPTMVQ